jgi:hypothetical protein
MLQPIPGVSLFDAARRYPGNWQSKASLSLSLEITKKVFPLLA